MNILLLTLYFDPDVAANAVVMTDLAEELSTLGHDVTVVAAFPHYSGNVIDQRYRGRLFQKEQHKDIKVIRTYLYTSPNKQSLLVRLLNYVTFNILSTLAGLFSGPQDVILAPSPPLTIGLSAFIISRVKGIPYVYNVQDIYPDVVIKLGILRNRWAIGAFRWLERFVYRHARIVTVLSEGFLENLLRKDVPSNKLAIIPNFVDTDFIRPLSRHNQFRDNFDLADRSIVLYAGNLGYSQDLEHVLESAALLEDLDKILFVVVGNGSRKIFAQSLANEFGLSNVVFVPFQPREDVPSIYAVADFSLIPLKKGIALDSVPSKAYTIMASGRPIIASVDPGSDTWRLVEQAECGLCVEPENANSMAEAIRTLLVNPELCERMGQSGREYVLKHHTRQIVGEQYHELLTSL